MKILFENFKEWKEYCQANNVELYTPVLEYEKELKGKTESDILEKMHVAFSVMREAVKTGLTSDTTSRSGMINNGGKKVYSQANPVLSREFQNLIAYTLSAKEVNSCMGRVVAAPTAGASGILPGTLTSLQEIHHIPDEKIIKGMLIAAGIGLIIEKKASVSGAVGGCQAETGSAAAMASGVIVYCLNGSIDQVFNAVAITIQCMLGLVCDPVAGLVEVPCVVRNASAAVIAYSSAQIAIADVSSVIPVDECIDAMGEIGQAMESRYKETAEGGLANTKTAREIAKRVLKNDVKTLHL
ncbi:MAG: L-serine ammonia-lyase, iron-sulfur-dependent, subunit alpha [Chitinophagaceae bacterium]|nr:L-serine ammonia-lyase, iron-sulfur-dependent, subunit alpha [Chitinophagaceae bacterium]